MKATFYSLLALAATVLMPTAPARAQSAVANASFETWAGSPAKPTGWLTTDDVYAAFFGGSFATGTVSRSSTAHGGAYAAQLQTVTAPVVGTNPGYLILGSSLRIGSDFGFENTGQDFTSRPTSLQFYYKLSGDLTDSASVSLELSRTVNGRREVVGYVGQPGRPSYVLPALAASYTLVTVPIQYVSNLAPDSVRLSFSSGEADAITAGTTLLIDDIAFSSTALPTRGTAALAAFQAYPNPSADGRFTLELAAPTAPAELRVTDALGREVAHETWASTPRGSHPLDLSTQPVGLYTVRVQTATGQAVQKVSIR